MTRYWRRCCGRFVERSSWLMVGGVISFAYAQTFAYTNFAVAQITPDGTLPNNSSVKREGSTFNITGGTQAGSNLFHSFGEFSIPNGGTAFFHNAANIQNIISRVTGGSVSNIDGLIHTLGTANVFLINPAGIIFGPNARLDVGGSFVATTANALQFSNQGFFSATAPNNPQLLTVNPSAFLFNQIAAQPITVNSGRPLGPDDPENLVRVSEGLKVSNGRSLLLVGGNVSLDGGALNAPGGRVELGGVAGEGTLGLNLNGDELRLSFPDGVGRADASLTQAGVSARSIAINAQNIDISASRLGVSAFNGKAGEITLNASRAVSVTDSLPSFYTAPGLLSFYNNSLATSGDAGVINIQARSISLNNTVLTTDNLEGIGGSISLQADDSVSIMKSSLRSNIGFGKSTGDINIQARSIFIADSEVVNFGEAGITGNININASNDVSISTASLGTFSGFDGRGGNINIRARSFSLSDGASLNVSTNGDAAGGNISVIADSVTISGYYSGRIDDYSYTISSGLFTDTSIFLTSKGLTGPGGNIRIDTNNLRVSDKAVVSAVTKSDGNGGTITVNANNLEIRGGGQMLTTAFSSGNAGNITVNATDSINISGKNPTYSDALTEFTTAGPVNDASGIFSNTERNSTGNGGNINIRVGKLLFQDGAQVNVSSQGSGNAGNLKLEAQDLLLLRHSSSISATAGASGNGGNITINTPLLIAVPTENSDIKADASSGKGGLIQITAQGGIFGIERRENLTPLSDINASSQQDPKLDGAININTFSINPSRGLVNLPVVPVDVTGLIAQGCPSGVRQGQSKFVITGRGGLPPSPSDALISDAVWIDLDSTTHSAETPPRSTAATKITTSTVVEPLVEATGWALNDKGQVVLTADVPTATPYSPELITAHCHVK